MKDPIKSSSVPREIDVMSRRDFLIRSGLAALWAATARAQGAPFANVEAAAYQDALGQTIFTIDRAPDLLSLEMELLRFQPVRQRGQAGIKEKLRDEFAFHLDGSEPGYVLLRLGGQHVAEQAIWDRPILPAGEDNRDMRARPLPTYLIDQSPPPDNSPSSGLNNDLDFLRLDRVDKTTGKPRQGMLGGMAGAWLAGHSLLVFEVPRVLTPLPFDLDAILRLCLERCALRVHPRLLETLPPTEFFTGSSDSELRLHRAAAGHDRNDVPYTSVEFPSMLYVSPYANSRWHLRPRSWGDRRELWSLDLQRPLASDPAAGRPRDTRRQGHLYAFDTEQRPGRWPGQGKVVVDPAAKYGHGEHPKTSLYAATRRLLVGQMAEDNGDILAEDFRLTALGATAHLEYHPLVTPRLKNPTDRPKIKEGTKDDIAAKPTSDGVTADVVLDRQRDGFLSEWIQKTEIGRDYYVKESFAGYWFPFQLAAESVTVTERMFSAAFPSDATLPSLNAPAQPAGQTPDAREQAGDEGAERVGMVEERLTALLVARKFGIVKERVREFGGPESDDFDDIGSQIARGMGIRRVEILVDRTPTLSNQGTSKLNDHISDPDFDTEIKNRLRQGGDGIYVTGGSGDTAGREVFWPRVAAPADGSGPVTPGARQLTEYRFPVRLTTITGQIIDTHLPMLFCYDLRKGPGFYNAADDALKAMPLGQKIALTDPQPAGAINATDLAVTDVGKIEDRPHVPGRPGISEVRNLVALLCNGSVIHAAVKEMEPGPLQSSTLARSVSTLLGGVREQLFDHVAKFRGGIGDLCDDEWKKTAKTDLLLTRLCAVLNQVSAKLAGASPAEPKNPGIAALGRQALQLIAWGPNADKPLDAARAAARLAELIDLIDPKNQQAALNNVFTYCAAGNPPGSALAKDAAALFANLKLTSGVKPEDVSKALPSLQAQWVARFGPNWQRHEWDEWFAGLFAQLDETTAASPCWRPPLRAILQKGLLRNLLDPKTADALAKKQFDSVVVGGINLPQLYNPFPDLVGGVKRFAVPEELLKTAQAALERIPGDIAEEGTAALLRLRAALEEALPDERLLRQRVQRLVEDYEYLTKRGGADKTFIEREITRVVDEARLQLAHVSAYVDGGVRRASAFLYTAAGRIEHAAAHVRALEGQAADCAKGLSDKLQAPKWANDDVFKSFLQHVAETPPAQSLRQFKNLLDETGVRLAGDFRDQLMEVRSLVRATRKQLADDVAAIDAEVASLQKDASVSLAALRNAALDHRRVRQQALGAIRRVVDQRRGTLNKLLVKFTEKSQTAGNLEKEFAAQDIWLQTVFTRLTATAAGRRAVPDRLASRVSDLLARIQPDPHFASNEFRQLAAKAAELERDLAQYWLAGENVVNAALDQLKKFSAQFDQQFQDEIETLAAAIAADLDRAALSCWASLDAIEQFLAALLAEGDPIVQDVLTHLLSPLLVGSNAAADLQKTWETLGPTLDQIQKKFGQTLPDLNEVPAKLQARLGKDLADAFQKEVATPLKALGGKMTQEFGEREQLLEGAALNLVRKAKLALACPSLVKSYRDESAKAIYHVENFVFHMEEKAEGMLHDVRGAVGFPKLASLAVRIPSVDVTQTIKHTEQYLTGGLRGLGKEVAGSFAELTGNAARTIAQEAGVSDAAASIKHLSREVGGIADTLKGNLKKAQDEVDKVRTALQGGIADLKQQAANFRDKFTADVDKLIPKDVSKLFGVLPMEKILDIVKSPDKAPQMLANELPDKKEKTFTWVNEAVPFSLPGGLLAFEPKEFEGRKCQFRLQNTTTIWVPKPGQPLRRPDFYTRGHIDAFSLTIVGMLKLHFKSVAFTAHDADFDFKPSLGRVSKKPGGSTPDSFMSFIGPLETIDKIREKLQAFLKGKNGPDIGVDGENIHAGYSFALPAISFGAVAIQNIRVSMSLVLPLKGGAIAFLFKLCERMEPFRLTVSGFAGGGYLGLQASSDRAQCWVEGSLEFGGSLSFSVVVAEGEVYLMGGVYFRMDDAGVILSGYVRAGGRLVILGFLEQTVQFYLALTYEKQGDNTRFWGICTVSIRINLGFFKKTVQVTMEKTFAGAQSQSSNEEKTTAWLDSPGWRSRTLVAANVPMRTLLAQNPDIINGNPARPATASSAAVPRTGQGNFEDIFHDEKAWSSYLQCFAMEP